MKPWQRIVLIIGGILLLGALLSVREEWGPPRQAFVATNSDAPLWSSTPQMSARENAEHHWRKHGAEFPELKSAADYEAAAHAFVSHPPPGTLTKHESDGDTLFYNPASNTFAVRRRDGAPRTMFKPDNGMEYWNRQ
jgi:pyocin large subunit-like protein